MSGTVRGLPSALKTQGGCGLGMWSKMKSWVSGTLRRERPQDAEVRRDPVPGLLAGEVRRDRVQDVAEDGPAQEPDLDLVERRAGRDVAVRLPEADLGEPGRDADDLVAALVEGVEERVVHDDVMGDRRLRLGVRAGDHGPQRRNVRQQAHVEHRHQDLDGVWVVRQRPRRDAEAALLELAEEAALVHAEHLLQGVGAGVAVEEDHIDIRRRRAVGAGEHGCRTERRLVGQRTTDDVDGAELEFFRLDDDRKAKEERERSRGTADQRPGHPEAAAQRSRLDDQDRDEEERDEDEPGIAPDQGDHRDERGEAGPIPLADDEPEDDRYDDPEDHDGHDGTERDPEPDAVERHELEQQRQPDNDRVQGDIDPAAACGDRDGRGGRAARGRSCQGVSRRGLGRHASRSIRSRTRAVPGSGRSSATRKRCPNAARKPASS